MHFCVSTKFLLLIILVYYSITFNKHSEDIVIRFRKDEYIVYYIKIYKNITCMSGQQNISMLNQYFGMIVIICKVLYKYIFILLSKNILCKFILYYF